MNRFRHLIFPLSLALILGGLSAWLERVSEISTEEVVLPPDKPQYEMHVLSGKRFNQQGSLQESIIAAKAWQLPDQKEVFFEEMQLYAFVHDKNHENKNNLAPVPYQIHAAKARYHIENKHAIFENQVILRQDEYADRPSSEIRTDYLQVNTQEQTAQTDAPVHFRYGQSHGSSNGLFYNHQTGQLDLPANVKAMIYDFKNTHHSHSDAHENHNPTHSNNSSNSNNESSSFF